MSVGIYSASSLKHQSTWHVVPLGHINLNPSKSTFPFSPYNWVRCGEAAKTNLIIFEQMRARTHDLSHYNSNHVNIWQECISDCYLMPNEHLSSISWHEEVLSRYEDKRMNTVCFAQDQHALYNLLSASSWTLQSTYIALL